MRIKLRHRLAAAALLACASTAQAQQSGTLLGQGATAVTGATAPTLGFQVAGGAAGKSANTTTRVLIDIGTEGNAASPPPDPALGAGVTFTLTQSGTAAPITFTPTGGLSPTFSGKTVVLQHGIENTTSPRGTFALAIVHTAGVSAGVSENYTLAITGLPAGLRAVFFIDQGTFTSLSPTAACGSGGGSGTVCPPCTKFCPNVWRELAQLRYIVVPHLPPGGPWPQCLTCPPKWKENFDRNQFDRTLVVVTPTGRDGVMPSCGPETKFSFEGGEAIDGMGYGANGECLQMVQHKKGTAPRVTVTSNGKQVGSFVATPDNPGGGTGGGTGSKFAFSLGGLLIGALAGMALGRTRSAPPGNRPT